jgi:hypothetical protein
MDWLVREWSDGGCDTRDMEVNRISIADEVLRSAGAILGGRRWYDVAQRLYDGVDGIYGGKWRGPVFVLSRRRSPSRGGLIAPADRGEHTALSKAITVPVRRARVGSCPCRTQSFDLRVRGLAHISLLPSSVEIVRLLVEGSPLRCG